MHHLIDLEDYYGRKIYSKDGSESEHDKFVREEREADEPKG